MIDRLVIISSRDQTIYGSPRVAQWLIRKVENPEVPGSRLDTPGGALVVWPLTLDMKLSKDDFIYVQQILIGDYELWTVYFFYVILVLCQD